MNNLSWIIFALLAAFFSGITSVLAKVGIKDVDSNLATAIRTVIILIFSIILVLFMKSFNEIYNLNKKNLIFLISSGIATSLLWISYFKALQYGSVSKVTPIDKTSIVLTLILSSIFLNESITFIKIISIVLILSGTFLMVKKEKETNNKWIIYAILTAVFASLATILSKIGLNDIDSNFASLLRTFIALIIIWIIVLINKKYKEIKYINRKGWLFIILSGISTGLSWLCYFKALQNGEASIVFPIEKLSVLVAVIFSWIFLKEKVTIKSIIGLILIVIGTLILIFN